jgi:hypothetical protein
MHNNNQLLSAQMLLQEYNYKLLYSSKIGITYFGFITPFFEILKRSEEIFVDATCRFYLFYLSFIILNIKFIFTLNR